jgi:D-tyrosyl-tRNA(Tyr) deacylase
VRAVVQRVTKGRVRVEGETVGEIGPGFVVLLGIGREDTRADAQYLAEKVVNLRVFEDEEGKMNLSLLDVGGEILAISQFTLYGDCRKGRRPSFTAAAPPEEARALYEGFVQEVAGYGLRVATGQFQAHMLVEIHNDGPVTLLLDSKKEF